MVRVLYHMQVVERTRCFRKFTGKSLGAPKILHMSENHDFERFGGIFGLQFSVSVALRALSCSKSDFPSDS